MVSPQEGLAPGEPSALAAATLMADQDTCLVRKSIQDGAGASVGIVLAMLESCGNRVAGVWTRRAPCT